MPETRSYAYLRQGRSGRFFRDFRLLYRKLSAQSARQANQELERLGIPYRWIPQEPVTADASG
ncbi:MAG: hypothetical protein R3310_12515 [Candidatus Competibacteraceae bacterium]|nr:hypothetical protein [Candidatus Competibacteraceae bacterium]